ncbi:DUF3823 domain-containing protein [Proteiniphilum sp. UBA1028]|jgi:hypothetical protein|uniref:DUF3823 domain-containing protein n=1 Tax=Proteiniphilum sp. UBA1028 TaxID=1947251 RepID=UPI000E9DE9EB|nr:DUF3823 domain-containing protein [Proteiniphilum sp. UBA1028]HBG58596.1 hypothetical protein [Porphyromonadaceae bacterium]
MKRYYLFIALLIGIIFTGCEYDNFDEPKSTLSGSVVYEGNPVGIRNNGPQLELWQDGYQLRYAIPVYIAQDGTYSVSLFDGEYKLVRKAGAPWEPQLSDTITINVKGNTVYDVPVKPYFTISKESFQHASGKITANFTVNKIVENANLAQVRLFIGHSVLTDQNKKEQVVDVDISGIIFGQQSSLSVNLSESLKKLDEVFIRVGVRANVTNEFYYTQVQKISLK